MSANKLTGVLLYGIASFLLGWLIYGMALMDVMKANTIQYAGLEKVPPDLVVLFISGLAWGFLSLQVIEAMNARDFMAAFRKTMPVVLSLMIGIDLGYMAFMNLYSWTWIGIDIVVGTIMWSTCNGVLGWWLGRGKTE